MLRARDSDRRPKRTRVASCRPVHAAATSVKVWSLSQRWTLPLLQPLQDQSEINPLAFTQGHGGQGFPCRRLSTQRPTFNHRDLVTGLVESDLIHECADQKQSAPSDPVQVVRFDGPV